MIALRPHLQEAKCGLFFLEYMTARWTHREAHEMEGIAIAMDQVRGWMAGQARGHRQHCVQPFRAFSMQISEQDLITLVVDTVREVVIENLRRGATPIAPAVTAAMARAAIQKAEGGVHQQRLRRSHCRLPHAPHVHHASPTKRCSRYGLFPRSFRP